MASLSEVSNTQPLRPVPKGVPQYSDYKRSLAVQTPATGFKEFSPRDPATQARYDAMQESWQGVESSDKAIASGVYKLDYASDDRSSKPNKPLIMPPTAPPPKNDWFCVVQ
jgi:hypothetical protein